MNESRSPSGRIGLAPWLALGIGLVAAACLSPAVALAAPASIDGDYQCADCHGYLKIQRQRSSYYKVWLGVGGGSCGAELLVNRSVQYVGGTLAIAHILNGKRCKAMVDFSGDGATVSDSCFSSGDEKSSTCALLGPYSRQAK